MRKSASESGSKNHSSSPPPTATPDPKIEPIDGSDLMKTFPSEYISIPANSSSYVPSGLIISNQVLLANHFARNESKGHNITVTASQIKDESNHESIFHWMFKRRYLKKEDNNMKSNPCVKIDGEDIEESGEEKNGSILENVSSSNTLHPPQCIPSSLPSSPFKMSYSSDEIDRLLQMTPEKSRWNKSYEKKERIRKMVMKKERTGMKSRNERKKSLEESSSSFFLFSTWNDEEQGKNDDEYRFEEREKFQKSMNNKEDRLFVNGIPSRSRTCSLCLENRRMVEFHTIWSCGCSFCRPCLSQYLMTCIRENLNVPFLSCPSADCPQIQNQLIPTAKSQSTSAVKQVLTRTFTSLIQESVYGVSTGCNLKNKFTRQEIEMLVDEKCFDLYLKWKTEYEVEMDPNRTFCPSVDCENICIISKSMIVTADQPTTAQIKSTNSSAMISSLSVSSTLSSLAAASSSAVSSVIKHKRTGSHFIPKETDALPVLCNKCDKTFCCRCRQQPFHFGSPCSRPSFDPSIFPSFDLEGDGSGPEIKRCPRCSIWIEREDGCAQMMCRKCRHVFCWFCLQSLEV